jgi:hypothetical protein
MSWTTLNAAIEPLINTRTRSGRSVEGDIVDQPRLAQERGGVTAWRRGVRRPERTVFQIVDTEPCSLQRRAGGGGIGRFAQDLREMWRDPSLLGGQPRPGALEQVMARIKPATFVLEPGEYKDKLPPLHTVEVRLDLPDRKPYEDMKKDFVTRFPDATAVAINAAVVTQKLSQMAAGFVYTPEPVWFSGHKFDRLEELLAENQQANTIVFYNFIEELNELKRRFPHARTVDSIDDWNAGRVRLLCLHPRSAGHGLNLQHGGHHIVWLSLPWSLELFEQANGRLHRSGQRHDVWCYVMIANQTVDEKIWAALHSKQAVSDIAMESLK